MKIKQIKSTPSLLNEAWDDKVSMGDTYIRIREMEFKQPSMGQLIWKAFGAVGSFDESLYKEYNIESEILLKNQEKEIVALTEAFYNLIKAKNTLFQEQHVKLLTDVSQRKLT